MRNLDDKPYESLRNWIRSARDKGMPWEKIQSMADSGNEKFFEDSIKWHFWPEDSALVWLNIVEAMYHDESRKVEAYDNAEKSTIYGRNQKNTLDVPHEKNSSWVLYRQKLENKGFKNIENIESECLNILRYLNSDTKGEPVKGMVVGNVQSGKTANMTGLIAMAADHGWNLFIILSGTIDSLRVQTRDRMYYDLGNPNGKHNCNTINHLSLSNVDCSPQRTNFGKSSYDRHLTVCLKNKDRLQDVLRWINKDINKKRQMKILVIDDEADHASVNTAPIDEERKTINRLILNLVNGETHTGEKKGDYTAMNYIAYTATPYANFLSEGSEESLYPRDFITLLSPPDIYFGPSELYGYDGSPGMSIINTYENTDEEIKKLHQGKTDELPSGLKDAVCWFICCVGVLKRQEYNKPVSMLIHTSVGTEHHENVANALDSYLDRERMEILERCEWIYNKQTSDFPKSRFIQEFPGYGGIEDIIDYPPFNEIQEFIDELIKAEPGHIKLNEDAERVYHDGIHLCIDNSSGTTIGEEENAFPRLLYPEPGDRNVPNTPAFIVVGGNTLSRGLTLEGLVSTYFARPVKQGDTLMQMGRWFGYRRGYELLPRLWMSEESRMAFEELTITDNSLRDFIRDNYKFMTPEDFPPKVRNFPKSSRLKRVTSSLKMRGAVETDIDFDGTMVETTSFDKNPKDLKNNIDVAEDFIKSLGNKPEKSEHVEALVWRNVIGDSIFTDFLNKFKFSDRQRNFTELEDMREWISNKSNSYHWNVVLAGIKKGKHAPWRITEDICIHKVERTSTHEGKNSIHIGSSLSSPKDRIADVKSKILRNNALSEEHYKEMLKSNYIRSNWRTIRRDGDLQDTPVLIIYCISKDSEPASKNKYKLHVEEDIIGISVIMPGMKTTEAKAEHLKLSPAFFKER